MYFTRSAGKKRFLSDDNGSAVGEFDEAELELAFLHVELLRIHESARKCGG